MIPYDHRAPLLRPAAARSRSGTAAARAKCPRTRSPSFERGVADGAVILETDVHLTRDGVPVLLHDDDVARTTRRTRARCATSSFAALRALDAGFHFTADDGATPVPRRGPPHPEPRRGARRRSRARASTSSSRRTLPRIVERVLAVIREAGREERHARHLGRRRADGEPARARSRETGSRVALGASGAATCARFARAARAATRRRRGPMALQIPTALRRPAARDAASSSLPRTRTTCRCTCGRSTTRDEIARCSRSASTASISDYPARVVRAAASAA